MTTHESHHAKSQPWMNSTTLVQFPPIRPKNILSFSELGYNNTMSLAEPSLNDTPSPRRFSWQRLLQYRLRTLLILTAIMAACFACWSHSARRQRDTVLALRNAGAVVYYDPRLPWTGGWADDWEAAPKWPKWLLSCVGEDYFLTVDTVGFSTFGTDANLEHLKNLTALKRLNLHSAPLTDAGLKHLQNLTALRGLNLEYTAVTDDGLVSLRSLTALEELALNGTQVSDKGLDHLTSMSSLKCLEVGETRVTIVGARRLKQSLPDCRIFPRKF